MGALLKDQGKYHRIDLAIRSAIEEIYHSVYLPSYNNATGQPSVKYKYIQGCSKAVHVVVTMIAVNDAKSIDPVKRKLGSFSNLIIEILNQEMSQ